ncbi:hypothetical protein HY480_03345 [Candidatus Uhrbacteria bacterium]|nr:hypothetical protein [Candidatus Uhrbacteria bacterium]
MAAWGPSGVMMSEHLGCGMVGGSGGPMRDLQLHERQREPYPADLSYGSGSNGSAAYDFHRIQPEPLVLPERIAPVMPLPQPEISVMPRRSLLVLIGTVDMYVPKSYRPCPDIPSGSDTMWIPGKGTVRFP